MTEDDARTKWCPMVRVVSPSHKDNPKAGYNRWEGEHGEDARESACDPSCKCIGSDCMMWVATKAVGDGIADDTAAIQGSGHCGLAK